MKDDKNNQNNSNYPIDPEGIAARTDNQNDMKASDHPREGFEMNLPADDGLINSKAPGNNDLDNNRDDHLSDNPVNNAPEGDREKEPDNSDTENS